MGIVTKIANIYLSMIIFLFLYRIIHIIISYPTFNE